MRISSVRETMIIAFCFLGMVKHCLRDVHCVDPQRSRKETFYLFISSHQVCNYLCLLVCMEIGGGVACI